MKKNINNIVALRHGFTLVEILVAIGILGVLMVMTVGVMSMSFKAKDSTEANEKMSARASFILSELKNNILNAEKSTIICPDTVGGIGSSIGFETKDGGMTTLLCDEINNEIASSSAESTFGLLGLGTSGDVKVISCASFFRCNLSGESDVVSIGISLNLQAVSGAIGTTASFWQTVTPRD